jgi:hypothetical protein
MDIKTILFVLAAICFALDALKSILNITWPVSWTPAGFCFLTVAVFLI